MNWLPNVFPKMEGRPDRHKNFRTSLFYPNKGFQTIEDAEPELVSSNGAENWYESTLWVMKTIFDMPIDIDANLLVHPAEIVAHLFIICCTFFVQHIVYISATISSWMGEHICMDIEFDIKNCFHHLQTPFVPIFNFIEGSHTRSRTKKLYFSLFNISTFFACMA